MAQFQSFNHNENPAAQDRILLEMGMKYAIGRDCEIDVIEAHKWLNIAAIRGNQKAERMRNQVARNDEQERTGRCLALRPRMDDGSLNCLVSNCSE
ncbi:hypothetical protein C057_01382 [Brucella melitensis F10/05-2]|nr:hypothetical protein C057_01382 [Brucella melitensis F10/05-2]